MPFKDTELCDFNTPYNYIQIYFVFSHGSVGKNKEMLTPYEDKLWNESFRE
jgi:hypothetical protein